VLAAVFIVTATMSLSSSMLTIALPDMAADLGGGGHLDARELSDWASPAAARAFVGGQPDLLSAADAHDVLIGVRAALALFAVVVLLGFGAALRTPDAAH
jgi:hypothetical protein